MPRAKRPHRKRNYWHRPVNQRPLRPRFLIVCEGERTEPNYFEAFRVSKEVRVVGVGFNTVTLVQAALRLRQQAQYDSVWCVFDKDSFPPDDFNQAIELARRRGMNAAYSNEAFELWYLLHFHYYDTRLSRDLYGPKLSKCLGTKYDKNSADMYKVLESKQQDAIRNAERLLESYRPHNPAQDNPCTLVHRLVKELNDVAV